MFDPKEWLESGRPAVIDGLVLRPQPHPISARIVLSTSRGQAAVYHLKDDAQGEWMLKKFHPGRTPDAANVLAVQSLVPREKGFEAAFLRRCLRRDRVSPAGFSTPEFLEWIDGALLMPRVTASDWCEIASNVRDGDGDLSLGDRVTFAENLCAKVEALESAQLAHRDLSSTNVMVDTSFAIHLIDWDSLFAPSLQMPANTVTGTHGYMPPFVSDHDGDAAVTWRVGGDRFAMAVLIIEAFAVTPGCPLNSEGGLIEQSEINARGGPSIQSALDAAARHSTAVHRLFLQALEARDALDCPSPGEWMRSLRVIAAPRSRTARPISGDFVPLDLSVFVQFDPSRFTPLYP